MRQFGELEAEIVDRLWGLGPTHFVLQMSPHDVKLLQQALDQARGDASAPESDAP